MMKGQSMIEFLTSAFFPLTVLVLVAAAYIMRTGEANDMQNVEEMKILCEHLAAKIEGAYFSGQGTVTAIQLPETIAGENYTAVIIGNDSTLLISLGETLAACTMRANPVQLENGSTVFTVTDNLTFTNENGVMVVVSP